MKRIQILCFAISAVFGAVIGEQVWLRDLNSDHDKRNLEIGGLPSNLKFALIRQNRGHEFELNLVENRRLGANAPVFEVKQTSAGKQQLVKKKSVPITRTKFYQDKNINGVFMVTCQKQRSGACKREVEGLFDIDGDNYNLSPSKKHSFILGRNTEDVPHDLVSNIKTDKELSEVEDYAQIEDKNLQLRDELLDKLEAFLDERRLDIIANKLRKMNIRKKRSGNTYAVEVVVAIDPALWKKYYDDSSETDDIKKDEETEYKLKQYFAHIYNGVSLRYESIDDIELDIYITLSGFLFYKTVDDSNPLPPTTEIINENGVEFADCDAYLNNLAPWASKLDGLPDNDHIAVFTGYDLYSGSPIYNGVAGYAWLGGVCNGYRVSVNEAGTYFETVSVAAHELGHNLNADHDNSTDCPSKDSYLMAPSVASFQPGEPYSVNPWRFSQCSIDAFKSYIDGLSTGNCLTDTGDYDAAYHDHASTTPGELYTLDEQCELLRGENSILFTHLTDVESEEICRTMACIDQDNYYAYYAAARGTPCGPSSENKWCSEGLCVEKTGSDTDNTNNDTDTDNTNNDTNNTNNDTDTDNTNNDTDKDNTNNGTDTDNTNNGTDTDNTNNDSDTDNTNNDTNNTNNDTDTDNTNNGTDTDNTNNGTDTDNSDGNGGCVNTGYFDGTWTWSCDEMKTYFMENFNAEPELWCMDTVNNWADYCCAMCSGTSSGTDTDNTNTGTDTDNTNTGTDTDNTSTGTDTDNTSTGTDTDNAGGNEECVDTGFFDGRKTWTCTKLKRYFKKEFNAKPKDWCLDTENNWASYCCQMCSDYVK